jgi:L-alanine-DL-glutamate epimerase-like enolase superfamily enzyme
MDLRLVNRRIVLIPVRDLTPFDSGLGRVHLNVRMNGRATGGAGAEISKTIVRRAHVELLRYRLAKPVGGSGVSSVDVIVIDLEDGDGCSGSGFSYVLGGSGAVAAQAARIFAKEYVQDHDLIHPEAAHRRLRHTLNRTGKGPSYVALAAFDVAAWDLYAKRLGVPMGVAMGGERRSVPVYGSGGFRVGQHPDEAAEHASSYVTRGALAVKLRVGGTPADVALVEAVQAKVGSRAFVAIDANEKCSASSATWLMQMAQSLRLWFVEEPLPARDLSGYATLTRMGNVAVATGEHLQGLDEAAPFLTKGLCQIIQPDLAMMGGLTECLRVARLAEGVGVDVAPHFLPNLFVHLAAASPNVAWLEDFVLLEPLFETLPQFDSNGRLAAPLTAGHGMVWATGARQEFVQTIE